MRRFPFFPALLLGAVALFFLLKVVFAVLVGLVILAPVFMLARAIAIRRFQYAYQLQSAAPYRRLVPVDGDYSRPDFSFERTPQRIVEII